MVLRGEPDAIDGFWCRADYSGRAERVSIYVLLTAAAKRIGLAVPAGLGLQAGSTRVRASLLRLDGFGEPSYAVGQASEPVAARISMALEGRRNRVNPTLKEL